VQGDIPVPEVQIRGLWARRVRVVLSAAGPRMAREVRKSTKRRLGKMMWFIGLVSKELERQEMKKSKGKRPTKTPRY
jgi:hypothetical protein